MVDWIGSTLIKLICWSFRFQVDDQSGIVAHAETMDPVIFAFWHNRMFVMPWACRKLFPNRQVVCLASASQDGEMIAKVLERFGLGTVRGSSSKKGREAVRTLLENLKEGFDVGITPDGPRGPCYKVQTGALSLSSLSGSPIIPVSYVVNWKIELNSWDKFVIPLPFSRCVLKFGKPILVPANCDDFHLEKARTELESRLMDLGNEQPGVPA